MWDSFQQEILVALGHAPHVAINPSLPDDPLLHAMLRAAGRDAGARDAARLVKAWPPLSELRGNAAAKRQLWPRLRAERGQARADRPG